ncbi:Maleylacetoacetate isomerase [Melanomma pulvis-pyrius CBS 109.77]|uniref:Maleylacetoacetate isomerase n=1 Tax=Melanomma pulvis-pyrius CBS 109.77 TaxID=1314802 RepID=A0A6A6X8M9_9PLEO|nr:Maleylacetoacetate isomerase [Melanomma pulvis-pyrius CBS 109.77]
MDSSLPKSVAYHLYTFFASSCASRIRIAFHLKDIPLTSHYINMGKDEHESESYRAINPSAAIPVLVVETLQQGSSEPSRFTLAQSIAILEYLEETFPTRHPLLPPLSQPEERARVREFMYIVTSDIFPPTNARIAGRVRAIRDSRDDKTAFVTKIMSEGFQAYEKLLERYSQGKKYSVSDEVTLADVCLVPQVEQARFYELDFSIWPLLSGVIERLEKLDAFKKSGYEYQGDTPEKYKKEL